MNSNLKSRFSGRGLWQPSRPSQKNVRMAPLGVENQSKNSENGSLLPFFIQFGLKP